MCVYHGSSGCIYICVCVCVVCTTFYCTHVEGTRGTHDFIYLGIHVLGTLITLLFIINLFPELKLVQNLVLALLSNLQQSSASYPYSINS